MLQRMLNRLRGANDDEKGFTLIELLVVILIIGILAAIALPTFLGQQKKAQDASAKSDVRNGVTQIESCITDAGTEAAATACGTTANKGLGALKTIQYGTGETAVTYQASGEPVYTVTAKSRSTNTWTISKAAGGATTYATSDTTDTKWAQNGTAAP